MSKQIIAAFDFDGTITTKDTFVPFLYRAFGYRRTLKAFVQNFPAAMHAGNKFFDRDIYKERVVHALFSGESVERLSKLGVRYAGTLKPLFRFDALQRIEWHKSNGHRCILVSASLNLYLEEVARILGFDDTLCTTLSCNQEIFNGFLQGGNCRCMEKINRLQLLLGDLKSYEIYAYGDSAGDREMIAAADHSYFLPF